MIKVLVYKFQTFSKILETLSYIAQVISSNTNSNILHLHHLLSLLKAQNVFAKENRVSYFNKILTRRTKIQE